MELRVGIKWTLTGLDKLRAVCSVILDGCFLMKNVRAIKGEKGTFVSLSNCRNVKGGQTEQCFPMTKGLRKKLSAVVLVEYDQALAEDDGGTPVARSAPFSIHTIRGRLRLSPERRWPLVGIYSGSADCRSI